MKMYLGKNWNLNGTGWFTTSLIKHQRSKVSFQQIINGPETQLSCESICTMHTFYPYAFNILLCQSFMAVASNGPKHDLVQQVPKSLYELDKCDTNRQKVEESTPGRL